MRPGATQPRYSAGYRARTGRGANRYIPGRLARGSGRIIGTGREPAWLPFYAAVCRIVRLLQAYSLPRRPGSAADRGWGWPIWRNRLARRDMTPARGAIF